MLRGRRIFTHPGHINVRSTPVMFNSYFILIKAKKCYIVSAVVEFVQRENNTFVHEFLEIVLYSVLEGFYVGIYSVSVLCLNSVLRK